MKKIFYNSSMPRAGSTLLQNLLGQQGVIIHHLLNLKHKIRI